MDEELASISEVVWLTPTETLDRAESLLSQLGYFTTHRSDYSLTAQRPATSSSAEHDTYMLTVTVSPQAKGGVKVAVRGDDREGMQAHQKEWAQWADSLPKEGSSTRLPTTSVRAAPQRVEESTNPEPEKLSKSQRSRAAFAQKDERERDEPPAQRSGLRGAARVLGVLCFIVGALLLFAFSSLILTGDQSVLAQIELGIWSMCFFLAGIYLKLEA